MKNQYFFKCIHRPYNLIINKMTRSEKMMENNNQIDLKF